jgi:large subunit ribosomal protein L15
MKLNEIKDKDGATKARIRVGRGIGSGKGKQSGRGGKGQTARSGVRIKGFEGGQMPLHRRLPKRGFTPPSPRDLNEVNLGRIQTAIDAGKLDGVGKLETKAQFEVYGASKSAVEAIERAGGSVKTVAPTATAPATE